MGDNGKPVSLERVEKITGKKVTFYNLDVREREQLEKVNQKKSKSVQSIFRFQSFSKIKFSGFQRSRNYSCPSFRWT